MGGKKREGNKKFPKGGKRPSFLFISKKERGCGREKKSIYYWP